MSLPVVTTPGVVVTVKTYTSPAMLVQIRDIVLSGMMFVLFNLGSGPWSLDQKWFKQPAILAHANWDNLGLLLRLSMAFPFFVAGFFSGLDHIPTFATNSWVLLALGVLLVSGVGIRYAGYATMAVMVWYMVHKLNMDKSLIGNLNGFKREVAFLAAGATFVILGGGRLYTLPGAKIKLQTMFGKSQLQES